jgi:hypothetical protein
MSDGTSVRNVRRPHDPPYLIHDFEIWAEATVHAENTIVDYGGDRQAVEAVRERLP